MNDLKPGVCSGHTDEDETTNPLKERVTIRKEKE